MTKTKWMRVIYIVFNILFCFAVCDYISCIMHLFHLGNGDFAYVLFPIIFFIQMTPFIAYAMKQNAMARFLKYVGNVWKSIFPYGVLAAGGYMLISIVYSCFAMQNWNQSTMLRFRFFMGTICFIMAAMLLFGGYINTKFLKIKRYEITLKKHFTPFTAVLISDLHLGSGITRRQVQKRVDKINSLQPDYVFICGDIFDGKMDWVRDIRSIAEVLRGLSPSIGVFACLGNHDVNISMTEDLFALRGQPQSQAEYAEIKAFFEECNICLLEDRTVQAGDLSITGRAYNGKRTAQELLAEVEQTKPVVVLEHDPSRTSEVAETKADLLLSGHTHRGQIFPVNFLISRNYINHYGMQKLNQLYSIVTSGVSVWGAPVRTAGFNEIVYLSVNPYEYT